MLVNTTPVAGDEHEKANLMRTTEGGQRGMGVLTWGTNLSMHTPALH
jgi:hypothetical protein